MNRILASLVVLSLSLPALANLPEAPPESPRARPGFAWDQARLLAIQDRGRLKPLDTFAIESVQYITGATSWNRMSAIEVIFGWLIAFDREWEDEAFVRVDHNGLKKALGLDVRDKYFSPKALRDNKALDTIARDGQRKEQRKERPSEMEKKAIHLQNQRMLLDYIVTGQAFTVLPNPKGLSEPWFPLTALTDPQTSAAYPQEKMQKLGELVRGILENFVNPNATDWNRSMAQLAPFLRDELSGGHYPAIGALEREAHFNRLHPFRWAWILYTVAFIALLGFLVTQKSAFRWVGFGMLLGGFSLHIYGFVLRCLIAGRPPVTNMYESVIWVSWGCVAFSLFIYLAYRNVVIPTAAAVFAIAGLVLADNLPLVLDPGIHPLEPVLRSNFWLTIHVLTITLSYAAFALSLCLGNVVLGNYLWRPGQTAVIQTFSLYMYRAVQIGVILLAAGTILGGVWADYSWGRFWGWDPKEVWALIALLLYLAVLHGRFTGWLRGFGFTVAIVVSFLGVLMAWYGVNFVLGVGLHSYGFGSGGMGYVSAYVAVQLAFIGAAYWRYRKEGKGTAAAPIFPKK